MIQGIPGWLFYVATAAVMVFTFAGLVLLGPRLATDAGMGATYDLTRFRAVRWALTWRPFRFIIQAVTVGLFVLVIAAGLFGIQRGGANIATVLTWTYWWVLLVLFVMLFGKAWCYMCPWDALAAWLERLSFWRVRKTTLSANRRWPRKLRNIYPAAVLFLGLTWLELGYGVTTRPELTALLALLMFFLAFISMLVFERRSFCRYGCLVGQISGLYSLFGAMEVRARDAAVCRTSCRTHDCYHGNERGYGCPTFQYLGAMSKNTYCIACSECFQTCPHGNVALNVRPFGRDLLKVDHVRFDEAALVVIMLAMSTFHGLTMTPDWGAVVVWLQATFGLSYLAAFSAGMFGFLSGLALVYVLFVALSHVASAAPGVSLRQLAIRYAYAFVPIALFYHFAHNTMHFFIEGGTMLPVISDPLGLGWNLLGTSAARPGPLLPASVVWGLMVCFIVIGQVWSLVIGHRIAVGLYPDRRAAVRSQLPLVAAMIAYSVLSLWIVAQPMQMRTAL